MEGAADLKSGRPVEYPVPWDLVAGLAPHVARGTRRHIGEFTRAIVERMRPGPRYEGLDRLPEDGRFVLAANHYQRKGLWILHTAAAITQAVVARYGGENDPPVRWVVTANWPRWRIVGNLSMASPGDWVLPKVAEVLQCYPVSFAGANPEFTARSVRRMLREARTAALARPIGIFPEGVAGSAGRMSEPLAGVERVLVQLARCGWPVAPCGVSEHDGRLVLRFGDPVAAGEVARQGGESARAVMRRIGELVG